jgi:putative Mg2+ transporter-C (MgtC) family protein
VLVANVVLRPLGRRIDQQPEDETEIDTGYRFRLRCANANEAHIRTLLLQAVGSGKLMLQSLHSHDLADIGQVAVHADLISSDGRDDALIDHAARRLSLEPDVTGLSWEVLTLNKVFDETGLREARA